MELVRDKELEQKLLDAVIKEQQSKPRTMQRTVGPSEIGGCRALLRSKIFDDGSTDAPSLHWAAAAHVGTVMGDDLERIFGERLDALTQQRITTHLEDLDVSITGSSDLIFLKDNLLADLKSKDELGGVMYEGPSLSNLVQISLYIWGAVQAGVLDEGAEGRLVYFDRSGHSQTFLAVVVTWEQVTGYVKVAQERLQDVLVAQDALEAGDLSVNHSIRDYVPSWCFSPKVECPQRFVCWGGSDYAPVNRLTDPETLSAGRRYIEGREQEKLGKRMKESARDELVGVEGTHDAGIIIGWNSRGAISVAETTVKNDALDS